MEHPTLEADALGEGGLEGAVDCFLGHHRNRQRHLGDGGCGLQGIVEQIGGRNDPGNQACTFGFFCVHVAAGEAQLHGLGLAHGARKALRATDTRNDTELDLGLAELRGIRSDDEIAEHRQLAATTERVSGDGGDQRLTSCCDAIPRGEEILDVCVHVRLGLHFLDVGTGGEGALGTGDQDGSDAVVRLEVGNRGDDLVHQLGVQRVESLRAVERDDADATLTLEDDGVEVGHYCPSVERSRMSLMMAEKS